MVAYSYIFDLKYKLLRVCSVNQPRKFLVKKQGESPRRFKKLLFPGKP